MKNEDTYYYYEVALALPAMWKQHVYTYHHSSLLKTDTVLLVPFGKHTKLGYVLKAIPKPDFATKPVDEVLNLQLPESSISLIEWLTGYYPGFPGIHVQQTLPTFTAKLRPTDSDKEAVSDAKSQSDVPLTRKQNEVVNAILGSDKPTVLHGITGSGKTRVYAALAATYTKKGLDVLILYPEISLSSQTEEEIKKHSANTKIHPYHSKLKPTIQKKTWAAAFTNSTKKGRIFTGTRSSLFLPYRKLGIVIIDESHDSAYKQDNGSRYNGILVAAALAKIHEAKLVLGSATPQVQDTQQMLEKNGQLLTLSETAKKSIPSDRHFSLVDMTKKESKSKSYLFSKELLLEISKTLALKKQTLLFLNRRGTARMTLCQSCGWHAECPNCDMALTYHHDSYKLQCHVCGHFQKPHTTCPTCSGELTQKSQGIKAIEQELKTLFPQATIARYDSDNKKKDSFSENYDDVKNGAFDIILGTQLLTKGLDLPLLKTVGILDADSALLLPDYTSEERAFQQLTQVSGRVGRGHSSGKVIFQTYQAKNPLFTYVMEQDWPSFYTQELKKRQKLQFPPYAYAAKIWVTKPAESSAQKAIHNFTKSLKKSTSVRILGPAPNFYGKSGGKYMWQIILLSNSRKSLARICEELPKDFMYDLDPISLL